MSNLKFTLRTACRSIFQKWKPNRTMDLLNTRQRFPTTPLLALNPNSIGPYALAPSYSPTSPFPSPPCYAVHIKSCFFQFGKCAQLFAQRDPFHSQRDFPSEHPVFSFIEKWVTFIVFMFEAIWLKSLVQRGCKLQEGRSHVRSVPHISGLLARAWLLGSAPSVCTKWTSERRSWSRLFTYVPVTSPHFLICKVMDFDKVFPKTRFRNQRRKVLKGQRMANRREIHRFTREKEQTSNWV